MFKRELGHLTAAGLPPEQSDDILSKVIKEVLGVLSEQRGEACVRVHTVSFIIELKISQIARV